MKTYWQNTGLEVVASFEDEQAKTPILPGTVHWKLYCETTQKDLNDWTSVSPYEVDDSFGQVLAYSANIDVPAALNALQNTRNATEIKALTVITEKDTDREYPEVFRYVIKRNRAR